MSIALGGLIFATSGFDLSLRFNNLLIRYVRVWIGVWAMIWLVYAVLVLHVLPGAVVAPALPSASEIAADVISAPAYDEYGELISSPTSHQAHTVSFVLPTLDVSDPRIIAALIGLAGYTVAIWQYAKLLRRSPSASGSILLGGIVLFGQALLIQLFAPLYSISFWLYHVLEFAGFAAITYGLLLSYRRGEHEFGLIENLLIPSTIAHLRARYSAALNLLINALQQGVLPEGAQRADLRRHFNLTESQLAVLEEAAAAVAAERRHSQEIEMLNARLQRMEADRQQLTQMIIHDLKNPITAIGGYLDILLLGQLAEEQHELAVAARRSVNGLQGLVSDLLDVERLEEGQLVLQYSDFSVSELLEHCAAELAIWSTQEQKPVKVVVLPSALHLRADQRLLWRIVLNLLSNAIKHTPLGTPITLRACHEATKSR